MPDNHNPMGQFDNRFGTADIIPHFNPNGTALTEREREQIAKRKGLCVRCTIKTHNISLLRRIPLTNENVYNGHCIKCEPTKVPPQVLRDYEHRNPKIAAPVVRSGIPGRPVTQLQGAARRARDTVQRRHDHNGSSRPRDPGSSSAHHSRQHSGSSSAHTPRQPKRDSAGTTIHQHQHQQDPYARMHQSLNFPGSSPPQKFGTKKMSSYPSNKPSLPFPDQDQPREFHESFAMSEAGNNSFSDTYSLGERSNSAGKMPHMMKDDYKGGVRDQSEVDVDGLLQLMKDDRGSAELLKETLHRVRNCGFDPNPGAAMSEIRDIMDQYVHDARVMAIACSALWRLAADDHSKKIQAAENGAIESIINALRRGQSSDDIEFLQWSVGCLASLADAIEVKDHIAKMGGIEVIAGVLSQHQDNAGVFEWSSRALYNLVHQPKDGMDIGDLIDRNIVSIEESHAIGTLVAAMKTHAVEPADTTALRWSIKLLWCMQTQEDSNTSSRILKKIREAGYVNAAVKILKARSTSAETDLFRLAAELMCSVCMSERSDSAFRDASDPNCLSTVIRCLKEESDGDPITQGVKQEACCRIVSTLMNGTEFSRQRVAEVNGVQTVLEAIERDRENLALVNAGLWAFWAMSCDDSVRDDALVMKASQVLFLAVETQIEKVSAWLLPVCGFFGNVCLIPGMNSAVIPISAIVRAILKVDDEIILAEAENMVTNFCSKFPNEANLVVEAFDLANLEQLLVSSVDLSRSFCGLLSAVSANSDTARGRMATSGILEGLLAKLRNPSSASMQKPYLEFLATLVIGGTQKATRMPDDLVQVALGILETNPNKDIKIVCCALLRNALLSAASAPNVDGLVTSMVRLIEDPSSQEDLKAQGCCVLWALSGKYTRQDSTALSEMHRCMVQILTHYKGDQGPFDYDLLAMAAGALGSITHSMVQTPTQVSSEDVDEVISVPYTALDFEAERTELYVRILSAIYNLSYVSDAVLIQCGVIVVVIDTMAEFEQCLEVQQFGCAILAVLASTENLQVNLSIVQTDGIDMIVNALALFADDGVVQSQACKALSHLSIDEESRMLIASLGGLMLLGNTMRGNMQDLDLLEGALSAVLSLSADADVELLVESNIVAVVVAVMRQHPIYSQLQEFGMGVLQNISMRCFDSKQTIADAGGIIAVTECIREFMGSPAVLERAFTTLWSLAVLDQNQALIADADGINLVVNGMMTAISYEGVQKQGCGCLCTLSSDSRNKGLIQNVGGVDSIVFAMWAHYASEDIQVEACRALSSLAVDAQTNEVMIASDGEVNAIISAMRRFPVSDRLQEHACVALRNFLLSADNVDIIRSNENEVRLLVQQAASRFPDQCRERANQILASLG